MYGRSSIYTRTHRIHMPIHMYVCICDHREDLETRGRIDGEAGGLAWCILGALHRISYGVPGAGTGEAQV